MLNDVMRAHHIVSRYGRPTRQRSQKYRNHKAKVPQPGHRKDNPLLNE